MSSSALTPHAISAARSTEDSDRSLSPHAWARIELLVEQALDEARAGAPGLRPRAQEAYRAVLGAPPEAPADDVTRLVWRTRVACLALLSGEQAATRKKEAVGLEPEPEVEPQTDWLGYVRQTAWRSWLGVLGGEPEHLAAIRANADRLTRLQPDLESPFMAKLRGGLARKVGNELLSLYLLVSAAKALATGLVNGTPTDTTAIEQQLNQRLTLVRSACGRMSAAFNGGDVELLGHAARVLVAQQHSPRVASDAP